MVLVHTDTAALLVQVVRVGATTRSARGGPRFGLRLYDARSDYLACLGSAEYAPGLCPIRHG